MSDCIFCKIIGGEIPAQFVYRNEHVVAIRDVNPQAPEHVLVMPVRHVQNVAEFTSTAEAPIVAMLMHIVAEIGSTRGPEGFRAVINTGRDGGQTVDHLHVHVLAGRGMQWPPG